MLVSHYNQALVLCSILVAIFASYTALHMANRVASARQRVARRWLAGGSVAMGIGIWSMHFIGMLAFHLPIPLGYDPALTLLSLLIAIVSSIFALWLVSRQTLPWQRLLGGALLLGAGIASMHYTGMAALRMQPGISYQPGLLLLSIGIAVLAAGAALWIAFRLKREKAMVVPLRAGAAVVMGISIVGMHYTGMAAAQFPDDSICGAARGGFSTGWLALVVIVVTLAVLAMALTVSLLELRLAARTSSLRSSLAEANQELAHMALHDSLTKLPNRILLEERIGHALRGTRRGPGGFALMFMDLDGFKAINDAYGHHIGDQLLVEVAQRLQATVRPQDTVARVGGDEFVLLASLTEAQDAAMLAERVMTEIRAPFVVSGLELRVSTSIGIALHPADGDQAPILMRNADAAMYHAKNHGRNTYSFFEASMNANVRERQQLMQDLRLALERRELILHYQPKFCAAGTGVTGVEALLRWQHPQRGLIGPDRFIPLAEKSGLIVDIGAWVLDEACRQLKAWHAAGREHWSMAVNLSAQQFNHAHLVQTVQAALDRHALDARHLTLEITESTAMHDVDESLRILLQLRAMGVNISIDDFGTGYSSLLYLKRLPASELKIDRGFVRELAQDSEDAAIVSAIVALGQALKLQIVAEGVETAAQQDFLTRLGCNSLQGYLLGRPVSAEQLDRQLAEAAPAEAQADPA